MSARTTLILPEPLLNKARKALGTKTKTQTVITALSDAIRRKMLAEMTSSLAGRFSLNLSRVQLRRMRRPRIA